MRDRGFWLVARPSNRPLAQTHQQAKETKTVLLYVACVCSQPACLPPKLNPPVEAAAAPPPNEKAGAEDAGAAAPDGAAAPKPNDGADDAAPVRGMCREDND